MTRTYSGAREHLAEIWDEVEDSREEVILRRRGHEDLALLPARELRSLKETAHLLRSPRNAARLLKALARSRQEEGIEFESLEALAAEVGVSE
ncbi:MAG TPA: type II toxin-antitoxin system prevent-host-death family antitoxin [Longimicrobiaceae bacterium]|nr:type II toxin-antitoxin system prevent-host-death family antitoxin [Longimicrobiaceae bacterium]